LANKIRQVLPLTGGKPNFIKGCRSMESISRTESGGSDLVDDAEEDYDDVTGGKADSSDVVR